MQSWCLGLLLILATPGAMAQTNWLGDVLVQRLPNGDAYAEVQLAWQSDASTASDSLTVTLVATKDSEILGFHSLEELNLARFGHGLVFLVAFLERRAVEIVQILHIARAEEGPLTLLLHTLHE